jgi:transposase
MMPEGVPIYVATTPVDLRYGMERLGGLVRAWMGQEPRMAALFVFIGKRRTGLKILSSDRTGVLLLGKRLDAGTFVVPDGHGAGDGAHHRVLTETNLRTLFMGEARTHKKKVTCVVH